MKDEHWWFSYECLSGKGCDVVLDVRLFVPLDYAPRIIHCPICNIWMTFKGKWKADEAGFGSRGDK